MKHVECNMKHGLCEAKIDKPCNKLFITWFFVQYVIYFSRFYILHSPLGLVQYKKSRKIYPILHSHPCNNNYILAHQIFLLIFCMKLETIKGYKLTLNPFLRKILVYANFGDFLSFLAEKQTFLYITQYQHIRFF